MRKGPLVNLLLATLFVVLTGCSTVGVIRHQYIMRGQILDVSDGEIYLCIGSNDGAQIGQELTAYRFVKTGQTIKGAQFFRRETTGTVRITEIIDEHYAKANLLTGKADVNNIVELEKK